jgi:hypothetical protein
MTLLLAYDVLVLSLYGLNIGSVRWVLALPVINLLVWFNWCRP